MNTKIAILLGSETDRETMEAGNKYYEYFGLDYEIFIMSAHRNPKDVHQFASSARENGYAVLVGAAGMAAHLAGALGVKTLLIKPANHASYHYWNYPDNNTPWYKSVKMIDKEYLNDFKFIKKIVLN